MLAAEVGDGPERRGLGVRSCRRAGRWLESDRRGRGSGPAAPALLCSDDARPADAYAGAFPRAPYTAGSVARQSIGGASRVATVCHRVRPGLDFSISPVKNGSTDGYRRRTGGVPAIDGTALCGGGMGEKPNGTAEAPGDGLARAEPRRVPPPLDSGERNIRGRPKMRLTSQLSLGAIIKSARAPERQSARAPERQSARAPERQSARAPERQSARAPERQSARAPELTLAAPAPHGAGASSSPRSFSSPPRCR